VTSSHSLQSETRTPSPAKVKAFLKRHFIWLPLAFTVLWAGVPMLWALSASFKSPLDVYAVPPQIIPANPTTEHYAALIGDPSFWMFMRNSAILTVSSTIAAIAISTIAAYGFARYAFRWRHILLIFILVPRLVPRVSLIVPIYQMASAAGLTNSYLALIIVYTGTAIPLATWIMIGFITAIPKDLEEAGRIDGASTWQVFVRLVIPLSVPGLLTIGVLSFREGWNEFPFILALTTDADVRTLPYQLFLLLDAAGIQNWPLVQAFTILSILPIILLYLRFEKHVVSGLTQGAVK
jgi:ABC-type glycerol-3-phosphate transport system permease component